MNGGPRRLCAFDLDGTLVESARDIVLHANAALAALGRPPWDETAARPLIGRGARALLQDMLGPGVTGAQLQQAVEHFAHSYQARPVVHTTLWDGARPMLDALRARNVATAVVTNKLHTVTLALLEALGLQHALDVVVGAQPGMRPKPAPDMLAHAATAVGATPATTTYVGDSGVDLETARAFGCAFVGVGHGMDGGAALRDAGVPLCAGLGDVCAQLVSRDG